MHERLLKRILPARDNRPYESRDGRGGSDVARAECSAHVQSIAETILRTAKDGERDPAALQRMALLELQITPRN